MSHALRRERHRPGHPVVAVALGLAGVAVGSLACGGALLLARETNAATTVSAIMAFALSATAVAGYSFRDAWRM